MINGREQTIMLRAIGDTLNERIAKFNEANEARLVQHRNEVERLSQQEPRTDFAPVINTSVDLGQLVDVLNRLVQVDRVINVQEPQTFVSVDTSAMAAMLAKTLEAQAQVLQVLVQIIKDLPAQISQAIASLPAPVVNVSVPELRPVINLPELQPVINVAAPTVNVPEQEVTVKMPTPKPRKPLSMVIEDLGQGKRMITEVK